MKRILLTRAESAIEYFFIERVLNNNSTIFSDGQKKLATIIGFHENAVGQALASLEERGWISRYKEGNKNIIKFCLSVRELNLRLSYCSEVICKSIVDVEFLSEFESINEKYRQAIKQRQDQLQKGEELEQLINQKANSVTETQLWYFVENLYIILNDVFDNRTFKDKVKCVIRKFQTKYGYDEQDESCLDNLNSSVEFKSKAVIEGFWEVRQKSSNGR